MKKNNILIILLMLFIPNIIFASSFSVGISCPNGTPGEKVTCKITANVDENISEIKGSFGLEGISSLSFSKNDKLNFTKADSDGFDIVENDGIQSKLGTNSFEIGSVSVTIPSDASESSTYKVIVKDISATDKSSSTLNQGNVTSTIAIKSNDNLLKSLTVGNYSLTPAFNPNTFSYKVNAEDISKITINAVANNSKATISGAGERSLDYGDNTIKVVVKSESGIEKTYKIIINRFDSRDKTNTLNNLVVAGYDLDKAFDPNTTNYKVTVESNVTEVKLSAELTPSEEKQKVLSSFVKNYGPRTVKKLAYGDNKVLIKVRAENEKVRTYTVIVNRIDDRDPNNNLKTLEISNGRYKFDKDITSYIINVENNVSVVSVKAEAESEKAKIEFPAKVELKEGGNRFSIKVTAENEKEKEYKITINRLREGITVEEVENISYLKSLIVINRNINFNQKTTEYEIPITTETEVTFQYELFEDIEGTIELKGDDTGPIKLSNKKSEITIAPVIDGSVIYLNVNTPEGYSRQFTFNVKTADYYIGDIDIPIEKEKLEIKWTWQLIVGLVSLFIIICEIGYAIYFAIKNGGVENRRSDAEKSIKSGIDYAKGIPERNEKRKEAKAERDRLKAEEKARKEEFKKKEAEMKKKQKEQEKLDREKEKEMQKEVKEFEKKLLEEKKQAAKEAETKDVEYVKELENMKGKY